MRSQPEFSTNFHARFCVLAQYPPAVYNGGTERSCFHEHPASHLLRALRQSVHRRAAHGRLRRHGAYWYNPNIHPFTEYRSRRNCLRDYAASIGLPLIERNDYGLRPFVRAVAEDIDGRCVKCYSMRLYAAAHEAKEGGFDSFTSSLFISPYQNHELLREVAERAAAEYGVTFLYRDFRPLFRAGQERARELGMYIQKYCGASSPRRSAISRRRKFCGERLHGSQHFMHRQIRSRTAR